MNFHYRLVWTVARTLARLLWGFRTLWSERIPREGRVVIACNHVSNLDAVFASVGCPREVSFLAKEELFRNPLFAWFIRSCNAIPIRRGILDRRALRTASRLLDADEAILMFPEGRRSPSGEIGDGRPGVGFIAGTSAAPIVPAYITGSRALGQAFRRRPPVTVAYGEPIAPGKAETSEDYRALTDRIMEGIRALKSEVEGR